MHNNLETRELGFGQELDLNAEYGISVISVVENRCVLTTEIDCKRNLSLKFLGLGKFAFAK